MEQYVEALKKQKIRITPQRLAVLRVLWNNHRHFSTEEVYGEVKKDFPAISLATVYTILDLLKQKGLIRELRIKSDKTLFEARVDMHHHFLCRDCGTLFDIDMKPCAALEAMAVDGNVIEEAHGYFYGVCKKCK
ncbi:MAG: transcriptional repressor [Candidatus Omnitrophica bacterium]|nr:transcriptional repressor [Candidatus Omnitrophota bacterium]